MLGILNIYKVGGITSSDVVVKVKKILKTRAVGHMGTLDPQGEGVLILGVGKATRLFNYYLGKDKVYEAEFTFGEERDTLDGEGSVIASGGRMPSKEEILQKLPLFTGEILQTPPLYSAKKVNGRKAYEIARSGETVELPPCKVNVYDFSLTDIEENRIRVTIHCSAGTYIRSLCRDLAHSLGTYAIMTAIKRIRCGNFCINDSVRTEDLSENDIMSLKQALPELKVAAVDEKYYSYLLNGRKVPYGENGEFLVECKGEVFGIGEVKAGELKVKVYMKE